MIFGLVEPQKCVFRKLVKTWFQNFEFLCKKQEKSFILRTQSDFLKKDYQKVNVWTVKKFNFRLKIFLPQKIVFRK